jgi:phage major head subunit gpT-like protein
MAQTTGSFAYLLAPGLRKVFQDTLQKLPTESTRLVNSNTTTKAYEEDLKVSGLGRLERKDEMATIPYDTATQGTKKRHTPLSFALGFEVSRELYDDDQYNIMKKMSKDLAQAVNETVELEFGLFLDDMFTGTNYTGFDGLALCHVSHTLLIGGVYANKPSSDADFGIATIRASAERMERIVNDRGLPRIIRPETALVSPTFQWVAKEILGSEKAPYTNENQPNSTQQILNLGYMVQHYGSDDDAWSLWAPKAQHDVQILWRQKPIFESFDDPNTKAARFTVFCRFCYGFGEWRGIDGSSG